MAEDLRFMQREAARRVRQTQEHNRQVFEQYSGHPGGSADGRSGLTPPPLYGSARPMSPLYADTPRPIPPLYERPPTPAYPPTPPHGNRPTDPSRPPPPPASSPSGLDGEQWLLLGLALLLFRSGCRAELVVALLYLAM